MRTQRCFSLDRKYKKTVTYVSRNKELKEVIPAQVQK